MQNAIEVHHLTKKYNNFLLNDIGFDVPNGYICGFVGQNGVGKTTTLKLILSMILKDDGSEPATLDDIMIYINREDGTL